MPQTIAAAANYSPGRLHWTAVGLLIVLCAIPAASDASPFLQHDHTSNPSPAKPDVPRRPPVGWTAEWIADAETGLVTTDVNATLPLLGPFGSPPPLIKVGFGYTNLLAPNEFALPSDLFEYSIGLTWIRPLNERWTVLSMLGVAMATDNENRSGDAWQFRGGVFGIYQRNESWKWTFGALATGRGDLPVIPAIGAVWQPNTHTRVDLTFPRPRFNRLLVDSGDRQQWVYLGASLKGATWAYERPGMIDDQFTYRDWRIVMGWESRPAAAGGMPFALGRSVAAEIGYAFAREFEFQRETRTEALDDALFMGITTKF